MKISARITAIAVLPIIVTAAAVLGIALYQKTVLRDFFSTEIDRQALSEAQKIVQNVYLMCRSAQESVQQNVNANLRVANNLLNRRGPVTFGTSLVHWQTINQFNQAEQTLSLPPLLVGGRWLGQNRDPRIPTLVVDETRDLVGGTVTIFQRMNSTGDMLRVATNVLNSDGNRAIGTFIPANEPDGRVNPVVATLLRGETFHGRAFVVNAWYITAYQPIWNPSHTEVVGALYVGIKQESLQSLRKGIMDIHVGQDGYVWILGGHGEQRGRYIISKQGERDGEYLLDITDADNQLFVKRMVDKALALPAPKDAGLIPVAYDRYPWKNPGEKDVRFKSVALGYFAPWDWVIGAAYYESDFEPLQQRMATALNRMAIWVSATALLMALFAVPVGRLVAARILSQVDSILKSVKDVLIVTDSTDRIHLLSQAAEDLFGKTLQQVHKRPISALITDGKTNSIFAEVIREGKNGAIFTFEWPSQTVGQTHLMQGRISLIQTRGGTPLGMILAIHDITGEQAIERMKNELVSTAAHELNTPLTAIIAYSELLLESQELSRETHQEALGYINQKAWALSKIVDDLLDVSRIESGQGIPIILREDDLVEVVRAVHHFACRLSSHHAFTIELPDEPCRLLIDRSKIEEVLENIISNAIKYSPSGGTIKISGKRTENGFHLAIQDEGIGMTSEQIAHVFDKFYRANCSNTAINGTGLGMTIVKSIIDRHNGQIWIESEAGHGTTVHILIPRETSLSPPL